MKSNLKEVRKRAGLTQQQVAERAGLPLRTYQSYELDKRQPSVYAALKIAKILKSSVEKLFSIST